MSTKTKKPLLWNTYEALALSKFDGRPYSSQAKIGKHPINFVTRVQGEISVSPSFSRLFVTIPDLQRIIQAAMSDYVKRGVTLEEIVAASFAGEMNIDATKELLKNLIGAHKEPTVCPNIQGKIDFKRLSR